jgi:hypothetical protein
MDKYFWEIREFYAPLICKNHVKYETAHLRQFLMGRHF